MRQTSVTSKGQVTIPKSVRQKLGIRKGTQISFEVIGNHVEMRVEATPVEIKKSGFGLLKSRKKAVPVDFDPAELIKP